LPLIVFVNLAKKVWASTTSTQVGMVPIVLSPAYTCSRSDAVAEVQAYSDVSDCMILIVAVCVFVKSQLVIFSEA
jgi:hypothetical protein